MLEIYRYVPAVLLNKSVMEMDVQEFTEYLAKARYVEEVEKNLHMEALAKLFEGA